MKYLILIIALLSVNSHSAESTSIMDPIGEFVKSQKIGAGMSFSPLDVNQPGTRAVVYLKGIGFGAKGLSRGEAMTYLDLDYGGSFNADNRNFEIIFNLHPANVGSKLWGRMPMADRWRFPEIPKQLVGGPQLRVPLPGENRSWTWKNGFKIVVGWEF